MVYFHRKGKTNRTLFHENINQQSFKQPWSSRIKRVPFRPRPSHEHEPRPDPCLEIAVGRRVTDSAALWRVWWPPWLCSGAPGCCDRCRSAFSQGRRAGLVVIVEALSREELERFYNRPQMRKFLLSRPVGQERQG